MRSCWATSDTGFLDASSDPNPWPLHFLSATLTLSLPLQDGVVYLFYSVSVEACVFLTRTKYDTSRWTPGGNIMMVKSRDGGASWSQPQARDP